MAPSSTPTEARPSVPVPAVRAEGLVKTFGAGVLALDGISLSISFGELVARGAPHDLRILGAEIAGDYKPKPRVYLRAAEAFEPGEEPNAPARAGRKSPETTGVAWRSSRKSLSL